MFFVTEKVREYSIKTPGKAAIITEDGSVSYSELYGMIESCAAFFADRLPRGSKVVVKSPPDARTVAAYLGLHLAGMVNVPCEKTAAPQTLEDVARAVDAALIVCGEHLADDSRRAAPEEIFSAKKGEKEFVLPSPGDVADILFTTGTTGKSKGVMISHANLFASCDNLFTSCELTADTVSLLPVPINHANGIRKLYAALAAGGTVTLCDGLKNLPLFFRLLRETGADFLLLPPSAVRLLLTLAPKELAKYSSQIKRVHTSTAPFPEGDKQRLRELLPDTALAFGYGSSEVCNVSSLNCTEHPGLVCCVGAPNRHAKVKIVDADRHEINATKDEPGLIALGGDGVMLGYYNEPDLTASVLVDGWVYTSDLGYIDGNGFLYVLGRSDDVINVGGLKVSPSEVESAAMLFRGLADCACAAVDSKLTGKAPALYYVPEKGVEVDVKALRAFLAERLEGYKLPVKYELLPEIPKTANGKIDRKKLNVK